MTEVAIIIAGDFYCRDCAIENSKNDVYGLSDNQINELGLDKNEIIEVQQIAASNYHAMGPWKLTTDKNGNQCLISICQAGVDEGCNKKAIIFIDPEIPIKGKALKTHCMFSENLSHMESDYPQHCTQCDEMFEQSLTREGVLYIIRELSQQIDDISQGVQVDLKVTDQWADLVSSYESDMNDEMLEIYNKYQRICRECNFTGIEIEELSGGHKEERNCRNCNGTLFTPEENEED